MGLRDSEEAGWQAVWAKGRVGGAEGRDVTGPGAAETLSHCELGATGGCLTEEGPEVTGISQDPSGCHENRPGTDEGRPIRRPLHWPM